MYQSSALFVLLDIYGIIQLVQLVFLPPVLSILELLQRFLRIKLSRAQVSPTYKSAQVRTDITQPFGIMETSIR
jgi:hypothetical protein